MAARATHDEEGADEPRRTLAHDPAIGRGVVRSIRSYLATVHHGIGALDALTSAFQGRLWIPETG
jgi:hypothetical protein